MCKYGKHAFISELMYLLFLFPWTNNDRLIQYKKKLVNQFMHLAGEIVCVKLKWIKEN